jgi:hypothetical protein
LRAYTGNTLSGVFTKAPGMQSIRSNPQAGKFRLSAHNLRNSLVGPNQNDSAHLETYDQQLKTILNYDSQNFTKKSTRGLVSIDKYGTNILTNNFFNDDYGTSKTMVHSMRV